MKYDGYYFNKILNVLFLFSFILTIKSININQNEILTPTILEENETYKQYIKKGQNNVYQILFFNDTNNIRKILIDLMIFSGDVIFDFNETNDYIHQYQVANKIFYSITVDKEINPLHNLTLTVCALKNSYYSIRYFLEKSNIKESKKYITIPNYINFLITIAPYDESGLGKQKLKFINENNLSYYFVNFYFINCAGKVFRVSDDDDDDNDQTLSLKDEYYTQDLRTNNENNNNTYRYKVQIIKVEQGSYENMMCMVYVSSGGIEESNNYKDYILVGENIAQKIIFNTTIKIAKYLYQIPNIKNDLAIKFILSKRAQYQVTFFIKNQKKNTISLNQVYISSDQQEIIESSKYYNYCEEEKECSLMVEIILINYLFGPDLGLEVSIKSLSKDEKYPSYLIKNKINSDYLNINSPNYYYTDIGKQISGEVVINYYRGSGKIFGKIVKKKAIKINNPDWMGLYKFPTTINGTLQYTSYLKKLNIPDSDTDNCDEGCYLLLTVNHNLSSTNPKDIDKSRYFGYDISILTELKNMVGQRRHASLQLEKYAFGSVSKNDKTNYYSINIPYDAEKVVFDLQGENIVIYISLYYKNDQKFDGYEYPSEGENGHHWSFSTNSKKTLSAISKHEIREIALENNKKFNTLEGIILTLFVNRKYPDNSFSSIYALKYHLENNSNFGIYEVYCDQQTLCNSSIIDNSYRSKCLYMIKYNKDDTKYNLLIYPILEDKSTDYKIYADFIPKEDYDLYDEKYLKGIMPSKNSEFSTDKLNDFFLYLNLNEGENKYLYITIETDLNTTVTLLTTLTTFDYSSVPNPSTNQLFIINKREKNEILFFFDKSEDIIINIASIMGNADICWEDEGIVHNISGRDDRISLAASANKNSSYYTNFNILKIKNDNFSIYESSQIHDVLIIYLSFNFRSIMPNFDEFQLGKSFNLVYRETKFPLTIYVRNFNLKEEANAFVTIYYLEGQNRTIVKKEEFKIIATILSDGYINNIRNYKFVDVIRYIPKEGKYDPSKRVGLISFNSSEYERYFPRDGNDKSSNLVIQIIKYPELAKEPKFTSISIEGTVIQNNSQIPITENVYQHGKLVLGSKSITYKLSTDKLKNITCIIFSSNGNLLNYSIHFKNDDDEVIIIDQLYLNGKNITYINSNSQKNNYIYLTIFTKDNKTVENENITNYVFKYINIGNISELNFYEVTNTTITFNKENTFINIEAVNCSNCLVTYFVHYINRSRLVQNENFDNIAVIESGGVVKEFDSKNLEIIDNRVNLSLIGFLKENVYAYIQVIAYVNMETINEYIAYKSKFFAEDVKMPEDPKRDNTLLIVICTIGGLFVITVTALIIIIVKFNKKNKDLINKVNATSFQSDNLGCFNQEDENNPNFLMD